MNLDIEYFKIDKTKILKLICTYISRKVENCAAQTGTRSNFYKNFYKLVQIFI